MSNSQERDLIIKRGYLTGKWRLFEKKRWFVLKREVQQYRLDIYKDERAASKGEPTKGCILMEQVVEVQRTVDKKQTFEILCPGTGHKFTANSEAEADEWVNILHRLKSYRKERLQVDPISGLNHLQCHPNPHHPIILSPIHGNTNIPPHSPSHLQGVVTTTAPISPHKHMSVRPMAIQIASQPIAMTTTSNNGNIMNRQDSTGAYPSPSTASSDSSPDPIGSASTGSFDQSPATDEPNDFSVRFRISLKETEKLKIAGPCDLVVTEDSIILYAINSEQRLVSWPISLLRRYGLSPVCFSIETGRGCCTGAGTFFFHTVHSKAIYNRVHWIAEQYTQQLAIEGTSPQPLASPKAMTMCGSPKTTTVYGHESTALASPTVPSFYQTLHHNYGESAAVSDHRHSRTLVHTSAQQHQHNTGNVLVCSSQANSISSVIPTQHIMIHSPTTLHSSTACAGVCPHCSLGFQPTTPPSSVHFQRRLSSGEAPNPCYCKLESVKKRYENLTGSPSQ